MNWEWHGCCGCSEEVIACQLQTGLLVSREGEGYEKKGIECLKNERGTCPSVDLPSVNICLE